MQKKLVIAGSASLREQALRWKKLWEDKGCLVLDYPLPISKESLTEDYPGVFIDFFKHISEADVLFIMNEDKKGILGYVGAETFAEMCFGVTQKIIHGKKMEILLMQMPDKQVQSYDEIVLWLKLGWIQLYK